MYAIPWYVVLFVSIPESFLIIILGFALYNLEIDSKCAFTVAMISSVAVYFVRQLPLVFGLHTIIGILLMMVLVKLFTAHNVRSLTTSVMTGFIVMALLQCLLLPFELMFTSIDAQELAAVPWLNIAFFIPEALILIILYWMVKKYHLKIVDLKAGEKDFPDD